MAKFKGGVEEVIKMFWELSPNEGKKLLESIALKDPKMASLIEANLIQIEHLQYISASDLVSVLRDIPLETFGLALRGVSPDITQKILGMVSTGIKLDIEDGLKGPPRKLSEVNEAKAKVLKVVKSKIDQGHISLKKDSDEWV